MIKCFLRFMSKSKKQNSLEIPEKRTAPICTDKNGYLLMQIVAKPGSKVNSITNIDAEGIGIQINARPIDGEANLELVNYICSILGLKKSEITLDKGHKSRNKILLISKKGLTVENALVKLENEMKK